MSMGKGMRACSRVRDGVVQASVAAPMCSLRTSSRGCSYLTANDFRQDAKIMVVIGARVKSYVHRTYR